VAGPGRVELRLEEDVGSEESLSEAPEQGVEGLGLEEEEERFEEEETKVQKEQVETPEGERHRTFPLGEHEVEEVVVPGEAISMLRCTRCGASAKLTEALKLKQAECKPKVDEVPAESKRVEGFCARCGAPAALPSYAGPLCKGCADVLERYSLSSRPVVIRRGWLGGRHPADLDATAQVKVAWVGELKTFFECREGSWLCPYCGAGFGTLAEATAHTAERHPMMLKWEWTLVRGVGEVVATGQGYFCPVCGLLCPSEEELRRHYQSHEAR